MRLSIFTTVTNPEKRGDNIFSAMQCYSALADEVVVIDGVNNPSPWNDPPFKGVYYKWPQEFDWLQISRSFQKGYEQCTGDAVIHCDLDFIFHENDYVRIRSAAQKMLDQRLPAMSFYKHQFILPDRYNLKARLVIMVNKRDYGDRIRFDSAGDKCQPSLAGKELKPEEVPEAQVIIYNYDKIIKTHAQIKDDTGRMARAWQRHFGEYKLGGPDDESAYCEWLKMVVGRFNKPHEHIALKQHPLVMQNIIRNLEPDNWGYNGFGYLDANDYFDASTAIDGLV